VSDLPIFFQIVIVSFVLAVIFSVVWVYLIPEKQPRPPDDRLDEEDQEDLTIETIKSRRQAQERLFTQLEQAKHLRQQRQEMNAKPYHADLLPPHLQTLTLYALFDIDDDVYRALVYLQADHIPVKAEQFNDYWEKPDQMLWAWQEDNLLNVNISALHGENTLKELMRERYAQMKASLLMAGWEISGENSPNYNLISCYLRTR
jgi:hypothetical protein